MSKPPGKIRAIHRHAWLWEPLEDDPTFVLRTMFGTKAVYLDGRLVLCFSTGDDTWRGLLVATDQRHHASLCAEFPRLAPHRLLGKWLHLPESADEFETLARRVVALVRRRDPRIGVVPRPRRSIRRPAPKPAPRRTGRA